MAEYDRRKNQSKNESRTPPKVVRLLLKQTVASLVCGLLLFLMHTLPIAQLNNCADALGRALRHEYALPTQKLTDWVRERIPLP